MEVILSVLEVLPLFPTVPRQLGDQSVSMDWMFLNTPLTSVGKSVSQLVDIKLQQPSLHTLCLSHTHSSALLDW